MSAVDQPSDNTVRDRDENIDAKKESVEGGFRLRRQCLEPERGHEFGSAGWELDGDLVVARTQRP
jgi:hypothetical protein